MEPLEAASRFGISANKAVRSPQSNLSTVYILDDEYVLRSRRCIKGLNQQIAHERELLGILQSAIHVQVPLLLPVGNGNFYVPDKDRVWTVYRWIEGQILCNWTELYKMTEQQWAAVFSFMRNMHEKTRGKVPYTTYSYSQDVRRGMKLSHISLTPKASRRIEKSLSYVGYVEHTQLYERCFVHGDFHPGNMLFVGKKVNGLIDTDWCRSSVHLEDIAYLIVMMLRDYRRKTFDSVNIDLIEKATFWYKLDERERSALIEYIVTTAAHEMHLFSRYFPDHPHHIEFQRQMIEKVTDVL